MSSATPSLRAGGDDYPVRFALLPLENGDRGLVLHHPETGWIACNMIPLYYLTDDKVAQLIHLEVVPTPEVPENADDLVAQFREQLKMGDDE